MSDVERTLPAFKNDATLTLEARALGPEIDATVSLKQDGSVWHDATGSRLTLGSHQIRPAEEAAVEDTASNFELREMLGRGGMGVVYAARQASLDRQIAVKMIQDKATDNPAAAHKFLSEAMVTGELDHPNIVPIHELGKTAEGKLFYAMKEVVGTSWDKVIGTLPLRRNLDILLSMSNAVQFAHDKGVIHRDLKPANVMLGDYGEVMLMDWGLAASVGNEKAEPLNEALALAGTPAYMAPEMARCEYEKISIASDIYLIGAILFEIVTGLKPHPGQHAQEALQTAARNIISPTEKRGELLDIAQRAMATDPADRFESVRELQTALRAYASHANSLVLSNAAADRFAALSRVDEAARYREFTEIIAGFQQALELWDGNRDAVMGMRGAREEFARAALVRGDLALASSQLEAINHERDTWAAAGVTLKPAQHLARDIRKAEREAERHQRMVRMSVTFAILAGLTAMGVMAMSYYTTRTQRDLAEDARRNMLEQRDRAIAAEQSMVIERDRATLAKAEEARQRETALAALADAERENTYNTLALARRRLADGQLDAAAQMLWTIPRSRRQWEWGRLLYETQQSLMRFAGHEGPVSSVVFSPDGRFVASEGADRTVRLWNLTQPEDHATFRGRAVSPLPLVFAKDGHTLLWGIEDGRVRMLDARSRRMSSQLLQEFYQGVYAHAFSPDGRHIVASSALGEVRVWDTTTGKPVATLLGHSGAVQSAALSPDGTTLATGGKDRSVRLWNLADATARRTLQGHHGTVVALAFSDEGRHILSVDDEGVLRRWAADSGGVLAVIPFRGSDARLSTVRFSPDAKALISTGVGSIAHVWDVDTGRQRLQLRGHSGVVQAAALSADGGLAATGGRDGIVRLWDADSDGRTLALARHDGPVTALCLVPNTPLVATASGDGTAGIWDLLTLQRRLTVKGHTKRLTSIAVAPDGQRLLTGSYDGTARIWDIDTGHNLQILQGHEEAVTSVAYAPDGQRFATAGFKAVRLWDASNNRVIAALRAKTAGAAVLAFSPDGRTLAVGRHDVQIHDVTTGALITRLDGHASSVTSIAFSPDGTALVTGGRDQTVRLWNTMSGEQQHTLRGHDSAVSAVVFTRDGQRLFSAARDGVRLWNPADGRELLALKDHDGWVNALTVTPDGRHVISAGNDSTARLWPAVGWNATAEDITREQETLHTLWLQRCLDTP